MKHGRKVKKQTDDWLSQGLDHTIKHFNDMFINNLSESFTNAFVKEDSPVKKESEEADSPAQEVIMEEA